MPEWLIPALSGLFGAILGGGGATYVVRLALTESLREVFAAKSDAVSRLDMHERLGEHGKNTESKMQELANAMREEFREFLVEVREDLDQKFTPTAARLEREHNALRTDLERAIGELRFASQQIQNEGKSGKEAYAEAHLAVSKVDGLQRLFEELSRRVGRMEDDVKIIKAIAETVEALRGQINDVLSIADERRRTGGKP